VIVSLFIAARIEAPTTDEDRSDSVGVAAVLERRTLLRLPIYRPAMIHFAGNYVPSNETKGMLRRGHGGMSAPVAKVKDFTPGP
jgi:hypothetical protein